MTQQRTFFGTDGIRGRYGVGAITPDFAMRLGWAAAVSLTDKTRPIYIGHDTRQSSAVLANAMAAGYMAGGVSVVALGVMPTPGVAQLVARQPAAGGILIRPERRDEPATQATESGRAHWSERQSAKH